MAPRPAQRFSPIQNATVVYRRRDYDDAQTANDNEGYSTSENQPTGPLTDIASGFNQQNYQQNYPRPKERAPSPVQKARNISRVIGKTTVVNGKDPKAANPYPDMTRNSGTKHTTPLASTNLEQPEKRSSRRERLTKLNHSRRTSTKKLGGLKNKTRIKKMATGYVKATRVNLTVLSVATPIWFTIQLPIALGAIVALGLAGVSEEVATSVTGGSVTSIIYSAYNTATDAVQSVTGVNLNVIEVWADFSKVLFGSLTMLAFLIGMITLLTMAVMYIISGVHCFFGEHAGFKIATFIFAMLFYLTPVLNLLPWFMLWGIVVWCYPK